MKEGPQHPSLSMERDLARSQKPKLKTQREEAQGQDDGKAEPGCSPSEKQDLQKEQMRADRGISVVECIKKEIEIGSKVVNMMRDCCCRKERESFRKGVAFYSGFFLL